MLYQTYTESIHTSLRLCEHCWLPCSVRVVFYPRLNFWRHRSLVVMNRIAVRAHACCATTLRVFQNQYQCRVPGVSMYAGGTTIVQGARWISALGRSCSLATPRSCDCGMRQGCAYLQANCASPASAPRGLTKVQCESM